MASLPADEDYAKSLLAIFSANRVGPGQSLSATAVNREFLGENRGRPDDYRAALAYSTAQGWLRLELGRLRLTRSGYEES